MRRMRSAVHSMLFQVQVRVLLFQKSPTRRLASSQVHVRLLSGQLSSLFVAFPVKLIFGRDSTHLPSPLRLGWNVWNAFGGPAEKSAAGKSYGRRLRATRVDPANGSWPIPIRFDCPAERRDPFCRVTRHSTISGRPRAKIEHFK